jgi:hypothetical protein
MAGARVTVAAGPWPPGHTTPTGIRAEERVEAEKAKIAGWRSGDV